jgi:hypothetical protein
MARYKAPVQLRGLKHSHAAWSTLHPEAGELPRSFALDFGDYAGPASAVIGDGRLLRAVLTPAELAQVLSALPALSMANDPDVIRAFKRITDLLEGKG